MTRPTVRVLTLLEILQRGGRRTVAELAAALEVDERTVRRYIAHLLELEVPVVSIRGRHGGYELAAGDRMPPLMLTEDEALAVTLGLVAGRRSGLVAAASPAADAASAKVRRSLPERSARRLEALIESAGFSGPAVSAAGAETRVLLLVASAARDHRPLWFEYTSRIGHGSARTLLPYGIVAHAGRWYATGHDTGRDEVRTFRLDRMASPSLLPGRFEVPPGFDPVDAVLGSLASAPWAHDVSVKVRAAPDEVRRRLPAAVAVVEGGADLADGWSRVRIRAQELDWVAALLAGLDRDLVVERPDELRARLRALADRLLRSVDASGGRSV
ncbi:helix-turn-helix transcriptional regulator [Gryllotalpicola ginsengisoli]|uniref:helix-turn-helix transcriptional regulator n=1 Tax=Gryllotalpicola ginsengisoli TaxID=444608 RepID=UPI0003B3E086|nr:YafY family protein [Gryllotalpicola ginsengisoli]